MVIHDNVVLISLPPRSANKQVRDKYLKLRDFKDKEKGIVITYLLDNVKSNL